MAAYVDAFYGPESYLLTAPHTLPSLTGSQQGCPCGGVFFPLGLQGLLEALAAQLKGWTLWYYDDGVIVADPQQIGAVWKALIPAMAAIGLQVNSKKCLLLLPEDSIIDDPSLANVPHIPTVVGTRYLGGVSRPLCGGGVNLWHSAQQEDHPA